MQDPTVRKRVLQLAAVFSTTALDKKTSFTHKVLEQLLNRDLVENPRYQTYSDAVKDLQTESLHELSRLASKVPNQLLVKFIVTLYLLHHF